MSLRISATSTATLTRLLAPPSPCPSYRSFLRARMLNKSPNIDSSKGRTFATSAIRPETQNHYQVLGVPPDCTKAELKKHFYTLSKKHHPDLDTNNPKAGERFSQISESYSVLSDPDKRRRYDRDHMRTHSHGRSHGPGHRGSFAGSRPASGLSKRRGTFRGPPPSFYAHGNHSANTARQASGNGGQGDGTANLGGFDASRYTDPGQFDTEFDASRVFRTQSQEDVRRHNRRNAEMARIQAEHEADEGAFWARFFVVAGIISMGVIAGSLASNAGTAKGGLVRGDGSRRDSSSKNEWTKG